jgi:hypothetical protein
MVRIATRIVSNASFSASLKISQSLEAGVTTLDIKQLEQVPYL